MRSALTLLASSSLLVPVLPAGENARGKSPLPDALTEPAAASKSHFRLSAGAAQRSIGGIEFETGSRSGHENLPFPSSALRGFRSRAGSAASYADRQYEDGYVNQDGGTANDGGTWYWGYEKASQLSSSGSPSSLSFHGPADSVERESRSFSDRDPGSWETDADGAVPVIQLDWAYDLLPRLSVGASLQYSYLGFDGSHSLGNFSATQVRSSQAVTLTDTYDLGGIVAPAAPYHGTLEGPGAVINNRPVARSLQNGGILDASRITFFNHIEESLDVKLHTLAFGPTVAAKLGPVELALGSGLALNIADWEATHTETLYVRTGGGKAKVYKRWADRAADTDILPGIYLQAAATLPLTSHLSLTAFGNYDWSRALTGEVGPSQFRIDPSGWMAGGMLGWSF